MSRGNLDAHLRRYYGSQEIDPRVLDRLKRLADFEREGAGLASPGGRRALSHRVMSRVAATAAAVAVLAMLPLILPGLRETGTVRPEALAGRVLREIALNHSKNLTVEFSAIGYSQLSEQMDELDFLLRAPRALSGRGLRMLGGRYCSIQGRLAAQIKLEDERGRMMTLYQTSFDELFEELPELQRELDGVEIRVWREDDLLFALAGSAI